MRLSISGLRGRLEGLILLVLCVTLLVVVVGVTPAGGQVTMGGTSGTLSFDDSDGEWMWVAVRSRDRKRYDDWIGATSDREGDPVDEVVAQAWVVANRLVGTGDCDETVVPAVCVTSPPQVTLPESLSGGSIGLWATMVSVDLLTDGDLTGGETVALTGVVTTDLTPSIPAPVLPVEGVPTKIEAAERAGADIVFVPAGSELTGATVDVFEVKLVADVFAVLCGRGNDIACALDG